MKSLVAFLIAFSATFAYAEANFSDQGTSSLSITPNEHGTVFDRVSTEYAFGDEYPLQTVFKAVTTARWWSYVDGMEENTVVQAYKTDANGNFLPTWNFSATGGDFKVLNPEIGSLTESGCCGSPDIGRIYRLNDGQFVAAQLNNSLLDVRVPNSSLNHRYLAAVLDTEAPAKLGDRTFIGSVGYFNASEMISLVRIYADLPEGWGAEFTEVEPILKGANSSQTWGNQTIVELWESDGKTDSKNAFTGFGIQGNIYYESDVENFKVQINDDKIDRTASRFSTGLKAVFVK